jgi:hypothetical protein
MRSAARYLGVVFGDAFNAIRSHPVLKAKAMTAALDNKLRWRVTMDPMLVPKSELVDTAVPVLRKVAKPCELPLKA